MPNTLLRLETTQRADGPLLAAALSRHLRFAPLASVLLRRAGHQQSYALTGGCGGCAAERCAPGCRAALLRRALLSCGTNAALVRGLLPLHARCATLLLPTPAATPLELPERWPALRLSLHWSAGATPRLAGLLLLEDRPADLRAALAALGWRCLTLPTPLATLLGQRQPPLAVPGLRYPGEPWLTPVRQARVDLATHPHFPAPTLDEPVPVVAEPGPMLADLVEASGSRDQGVKELPLPHAWGRERGLGGEGDATPDDATARLEQRLSGAHDAAAELGQPRLEPIVPILKAHQLRAQELPACAPAPADPYELAARLVAAPGLTTASQPDQIGVSPERLRRALRVPRPEAMRLLERLDAAGALTPPADPARPFLELRQLVTLDAAALAALLTEVS